jgi:hypothetical protein
MKKPRPSRQIVSHGSKQPLIVKRKAGREAGDQASTYREAVAEPLASAKGTRASDGQSAVPKGAATSTWRPFGRTEWQAPIMFFLSCIIGAWARSIPWSWAVMPGSAWM